MSTLILNKSSLFRLLLSTDQSMWQSSLRTKRVSLTYHWLEIAIKLCKHGTGYVRTYIVLPSTIYGIATGKLFDLGISNAHSIQVPIAIKASLDRGQGGVIGEGKNYWPSVEVHERESSSVFSVSVFPTPMQRQDYIKSFSTPLCPTQILHTVAKDTTLVLVMNIGCTTSQKHIRRFYTTWARERVQNRHHLPLRRHRSTSG